MSLTCSYTVKSFVAVCVVGFTSLGKPAPAAKNLGSPQVAYGDPDEDKTALRSTLDLANPG
ncbi:hypothetical protein VM1G_11697 [Cytospora mali]|uniref:Uncharacterized protein n=1 Tax=Cytospora mali TaxID=578113 RepID=A0A194W2R5_CYTMA|nr:hypothetical protein VM1G_11697 [Valsa mali]